MAEWVDPQENKWNANSRPAPSDFRRMEGNDRVNHDAILEEIDVREEADAAEVEARENADTAEAEARAAILSGLMTLNAVGSLALLMGASETGTVYPGDTIVASGGNLKYASISYSGGSLNLVGRDPGFPSGTWKCLGYLLHIGAYAAASLFVKIAD